MISTALIAVTLGFQQQLTPDKIYIPVEAYKLPIVGGQREIVMGPGVHRAEYLPHYGIEVTGRVQMQTLKENNERAWLEDGPRSTLNYKDRAVGNMEYQVRTDNYEGKPCLVIETAARYQQSMNHGTYGWIQLNNRSRCTWWVKEDGTILRQTYELGLASGEWSLDAIYLEDSIALLRKTPKEQSQVTLKPACGMAAMQTMFKPMVDATGKVVMHDKTFYTLNPFSALPEKYTVRSRGTFNGKFAAVTYKGKCWEIAGPKFEQKAFVTNEGDLVKIELPNNEYLHINTVPVEFRNPGGKSGGG